MAKDFRGKQDAGLFKKIENDDYMRSAVIECYETLTEILLGLLVEEEDKKWECFLYNLLSLYLDIKT